MQVQRRVFPPTMLCLQGSFSVDVAPDDTTAVRDRRRPCENITAFIGHVISHQVTNTNSQETGNVRSSPSITHTNIFLRSRQGNIR